MPRLTPLRALKTRKFKPPRLVPKAVKAKMTLSMGKLRRFALTTVKENYVARMRQRRQGECRRCGLCCKLVFECPFLQNFADGTSRCRIHGRKPINCVHFPIDERDLADRNSLDGRVPCGYSFRKS